MSLLIFLFSTQVFAADSGGSKPLELPKPVADYPSKKVVVSSGCTVKETANERADRLAKQSARQAQMNLQAPIDDHCLDEASAQIKFDSK